MIAVLFSVLLLAADTTPVTTTEPAPAPAATAEKKEKKVCREDFRATGSRMKKKICLTPTEWANRDAGRDAGDLKNIGGR